MAVWKVDQLALPSGNDSALRLDFQRAPSKVASRVLQTAGRKDVVKARRSAVPKDPKMAAQLVLCSVAQTVDQWASQKETQLALESEKTK